MKTKTTYRIVSAALAAAALVLAACADQVGTIPEGMGLVHIRLSAVASAQSARTTLPYGITAYYYSLTFTAPGKTDVVVNQSGTSLDFTVALEPATWTLAVKGYTDNSMGTLKVTGNLAGISVNPGTAQTFEVYLTPNYSSGGAGGTLSYNISFPGTVTQAVLGVYPMEALPKDHTPETSQEIDILSTASGSITGLPEGSYRLAVDLYDATGNTAAAWTGAAHIYDNLTTTVSHNFAPADFAACPTVISGSTLADKLDAALASPSGSYTVVLDGTEADLTAFAPKTLNVTGSKNISITLRGGSRTVQVDRTGTPLLTLGADAGSALSLTLQDITLTGKSGNSVPVVQVEERGTLSMKAGSMITGNTTASSYSGGGVYVNSNGTFTMSGGAVSGNTASSYPGGGGVYVHSNGTFTMSGGAVSGNLLSGTNTYAKEMLVDGTFKISGSAWPERVFLYNNTRHITIAGPLSGGPVAIDLGITSSAPITSWINQQILRLDDSYSEGDLASLKDQFTLGNTKMTASPGTEEAITGYEINTSGEFVTAP